MLRRTIVLCAVLFVSEAIINTSFDDYQSLESMYLHQINSSLLEIAENVFHGSSISNEISSKINEEIFYQRFQLYAAVGEIRARIKNFVYLSKNISDCIEIYNQQVRNVQSTLHTITACSVKRLQMYYIRDTYNDVIKDIKLCKENIVPYHDPVFTISECYYNAEYRGIISLRNPEKRNEKLKIINFDKSYVKEIIADCKAANKFAEIKLQMSNITNSTKECINYAEKNVTSVIQSMVV